MYNIYTHTTHTHNKYTIHPHCILIFPTNKSNLFQRYDIIVKQTKKRTNETNRKKFNVFFSQLFDFFSLLPTFFIIIRLFLILPNRLFANNHFLIIFNNYLANSNIFLVNFNITKQSTIMNRILNKCEHFRFQIDCCIHTMKNISKETKIERKKRNYRNNLYIIHEMCVKLREN